MARNLDRKARRVTGKILREAAAARAYAAAKDRFDTAKLNREKIQKTNDSTALFAAVREELAAEAEFKRASRRHKGLPFEWLIGLTVLGGSALAALLSALLVALVPA